MTDPVADAVPVPASAPSPVGARAGDDARPTRVRHRIIALIFVITAINYADRATFSIAGSAASTELGLSTVQTGFVLSAFAWA